MKIKCDVCDKEEASVFCSADEAALCDGCDRRVHHANKLATKHIRISLLHPSFQESPRCDICQERRAFLFCHEDRAILCRECDIPIHKANEHTQKHNRFLLTDVRISSSSPYPASSSSNGGNDIVANDSEMIKCSVSNQYFNPNSSTLLPSTSMPSRADEEECSVSTSSISEYLMKTLPGWQVDDFLDPSGFSHGFCKDYDNELQLWDHSFESNLNPLSGDLASRVLHQVPPQSSHTLQCLPQTSVINAPLKKSEESQNVMKDGTNWSEDGFTVPQISPSFQKSRRFW